MVADDVYHAGAGLVGIVDIGKAIGEAGSQMQQRRGWLVGHPVIAVGGAGHDPFEQAQDAAHAVHPVERRDEMHLRSTGVGETHIDAAADQRAHQAFRAVHRSILRSPVPLAGRMPGVLHQDKSLPRPLVKWALGGYRLRIAIAYRSKKMSYLPNIPEKVLKLLDGVTPEKVRFIKLGKGGMWWKIARDTSTLRFGFRRFDFDLCKARNWEVASKDYAATGERKRPNDVTRAVNQVKSFFELPESVLWFTIEAGEVSWCFAESEVIDLYADGDDKKERERGARARRVIDRWRNTDVKGNRLRLESMTTKITKVSAFQETIAKPNGATDLLRTIRAVPSESRQRAARARDQLVSTVGVLLDQLHQEDFELLIELVFSASGWKRTSRVGGTQKTLDIAMRLPTTSERCIVQVKSQTDQATFDRVMNEFIELEYERMFFAYHTPEKILVNKIPDRIILWGRREIAEQAIRAGLVDWILSHTT